MSGIEAIAPVSGVESAPLAMQLGGAAPAAVPEAAGGSFADILMSGLRGVDSKVSNADTLVRQFAVDDSIPVHQVTMALSEARLAVELAMQVRSRLVEGYRELMNMPL